MKKFLSVIALALILSSLNFAEAASNLNMTANQFIQRYNDSVDSYGLVHLHIGATKNKSGPVVSTFQYLFTPNVGIIGSIGTADGLLREVCIIASPKTDDEAWITLAALSGVSLILNPELTTSEREVLWKQLKLDDVETLQDSDGEAVVGNVRYTTLVVNGVFSFIGSAKDL